MRRLLCCALLSLGAGAQEVTVRDAAPSFQVRTNLVLVPVVVRDGEGKAVGSLTREDFRLFDKGKRQYITRFTVEQAGVAATEADAAAKAAGIPDRYIAYLFDDVHLSQGELGLAGKAAVKQISETLAPTDRVGVFTVLGGRTIQDFTDDRPALVAAVSGLEKPLYYQLGGFPSYSYIRAAAGGSVAEVLDYTGLIKLVSGREGQAIVDQAAGIARMAARRGQMMGVNMVDETLESLKVMVRRMAAMPGQRTIVFISPGFLTAEFARFRYKLNAIVNDALRVNVIVHAVEPNGVNGNSESLREPLVALTDGTGGTFFHNQNDIDIGMKRVTSLPEYRYVLGFTPDELKSDGRFHELKVKLTEGKSLSVQARRGYFAPNAASDPAEAAKQNIEDLLASRDEVLDIPAQIHTQYFKQADGQARLSVLTRIKVKGLPFRKAGGRNMDDLTVVSAVFDRDGRYVAGVQKAVEMRLLDRSIEGAKEPPVTVKASFDLKPGAYMVRVVVREAEQGQMAARSSVVEIPW